MANGTTKTSDGFGTTNLRYKLRNQLTRAEKHLINFGHKFGKEHPETKKRAKAFEAACALYQGLCGHEEPVFVPTKAV